MSFRVRADPSWCSRATTRTWTIDMLSSRTGLGLGLSLVLYLTKNYARRESIQLRR